MIIPHYTSPKSHQNSGGWSLLIHLTAIKFIWPHIKFFLAFLNTLNSISNKDSSLAYVTEHHAKELLKSRRMVNYILCYEKSLIWRLKTLSFSENMPHYIVHNILSTSNWKFKSITTMCRRLFSFLINYCHIYNVLCSSFLHLKIYSQSWLCYVLIINLCMLDCWHNR